MSARKSKQARKCKQASKHNDSDIIIISGSFSEVRPFSSASNPHQPKQEYVPASSFQPLATSTPVNSCQPTANFGGSESPNPNFQPYPNFQDISGVELPQGPDDVFDEVFNTTFNEQEDIAAERAANQRFFEEVKIFEAKRRAFVEAKLKKRTHLEIKKKKYEKKLQHVARALQEIDEALENTQF